MGEKIEDKAKFIMWHLYGKAEFMYETTKDYLEGKMETSEFKDYHYLYEPDEVLLTANEFINTIIAIHHLVLKEDKELFDNAIKLQIKILDLYADEFPEKIEKLEEPSL